MAVSIEFWRLVFCLAVVLYHSCYLTPTRSLTSVFQGGYIGVDFFFIVSGLLMAKNVSKYTSGSVFYDTCSFIRRKILRIYPCLLFAFMVSFIVRMTICDCAPAQIASCAVRSLPELMLLRMSGIGGYWVNTPTWYISAMVISMLVLFPMLLRVKDKSHYSVFMLLAVLSYGWLFFTMGSLENPYKWQGTFYSGLVRAFGGISLGVFCFTLSIKLRKSNFDATALSALELLCYLTVLLHSFMKGRSFADFLLIALLAVAVSLSFSGGSSASSFFDKHERFFLPCGELSFALYLNHRVFTIIFPVVGWNVGYYILLPIYILCSFCAAAVAMLIVPDAKRPPRFLLRR
ncbi:acyltransferase family protein [Synergistes jonesii]|uniref:Acyltransferase 3 domain-containing protein n=1 Tax=Synergistes jonesii TaxID=2754 RepID=A0A073IRP5_9BACT|nr:acyltransferase [Synergistes jonesii]KEJ92156.1 hypothetical protein EH55_05315 [Synergistes jonesii]OFB62596.1 hypothetical protein JS73_07450 [Synergistes jonesii]OFB63258.1 hypothetical protein JS79_07975 [Synergistes jonesii]OFB64832.1 hypothetical protein JS72_03455 [Synergistes jonesii]OFB67594.1 hypothetical protein JS78_07455 [Synergistes jonesii]